LRLRSARRLLFEAGTPASDSHRHQRYASEDQ
jgi:hypothetical protein